MPCLIIGPLLFGFVFERVHERLVRRQATRSARALLWLFPLLMALFWCGGVLSDAQANPGGWRSMWDAFGFATAGALFTLFIYWLGWFFGSIGWKGRMRPAPGVCVKCRYDLHGLTEPRCPECGTPFEPADVVRRALDR